MSNRIRILAALFSLFLGLGAGLLLAMQSVSTQDAIAAPSAVAVGDETWPHLRYDTGRSGYNADVGSFRPPLVYSETISLDATIPGAGQIFNIVTGPDRIFVMGQSILWGVNKGNPSQQWRNDDCVNNPPNSCIYTFLAYSDEKLVVMRQNLFPTFGFEMIVLDADTGAQHQIRDLGMSSPEIAMWEKEILILTEDENLEGVLSKYTLDNVKKYEVAADTRGFPDGRPVTASSRFVYANDDRILAYDTGNGQPLWVYTDTARIDTTTGYDLVATEDVVIVSQGERVLKLNAADGTLLNQTDIRPASCPDNLRPHAAVTDGSTIVVNAVCDREVVGLDYDTLDEMWRVDIGLVGDQSALAIGGDVLYVASIVPQGSNFLIHSLDLDSGVELDKEYQPLVDTSSVLVVSDGLLYTGSNIGLNELHVFERQPADLNAFLSPTTLPICGATEGAMVTFNFQVTNFGDGTTDNSRADLILPNGLTTLATSKGSCTSGSSNFCDLGGLDVGQQVHITATVVVTRADTYTPTISLSSDVRDHNPSNDSSSQSFTVNPIAPAGLDLQITDMEITQGIQNLGHNVPLVHNKATFVRVYGRTNGGSVNNVTAVLHGVDIDTGSDLGTLQPLPVSSCVSMDGDTPDRSQLTESFVFELPPEWRKDWTRFTAEINPDKAITESSYENNTDVLARLFTRLPRICVRSYPVRTSGNGSDRLHPNPNFLITPDNSGENAIVSRALTMLPVSEIEIHPEPGLIQEWEPFNLSGGFAGPYEMIDDEDDRWKVMVSLWALDRTSDDPDDCDDDDARTHYLGMIHEDTDNDVGQGKGNIFDQLVVFMNTGNRGGAAFDEPWGGQTLAHELGHNYSRDHVACGGPDDPGPYPSDRSPCNIAPNDPRSYYGLDFRNPITPTVIAPTAAGDLMSYASDRWPSEFTWEAIQVELCNQRDNCAFAVFRDPDLDAVAETGSALQVELAPLTSDVITLTDEVMLVTGLISPTEIFDTIRLPVEQLPDAEEVWAQQLTSRPITPTYAMNVISSTGILHSEPFSPTILTDRTVSSPTFSLLLPWDPAATGIELTVQGSVVVSMTASPSPPTVTTLLPNGGENFGDELPISWSATDPDGGDLLFNVLYSADGGASWRALATRMQTTTFTIDASLLPGSAGQGLVRVVASDGLNSAYRQSEAGFTLPDRTPTPIIYFPVDGGDYPSGSNLNLSGAAYDPEDGYLPDDALAWTLSGSSFLGSGKNLFLTGLADGTYTLTLQATDSQQQEGVKSINFQVGSGGQLPDPPILVSPANGAVIEDLKPQLDWLPVSGASVYRLQVDNDPDFSSPLIDFIGSGTELRPPGALNSDTYYWRARAQAGVDTWGYWSSVWSFNFEATLPNAPTLISPANGATIQEAKPTFDWSSVTEATMYQLQVDDNSDFSSPELDVTRSETDYTPAGSLDIATHYWRVRAQNAADTWGEWSEVWFFEIEDSEPSSNERVYLPLILRK